MASGSMKSPRISLGRITVGSLVEQALGKRARSLTADELNRLAKSFAEAGRHAVRARAGTSRQAAEALAAGRALSRLARHAMAQRSVPGDDDVIVGPEWRAADAALRKHRAGLVKHPDVIGFGLSHRRRGGKESEERVVTVMVAKKLSPEELKRLKRRPVRPDLPVGDGRRVPVDVVQVSPLRLQFVAGSSLGPPGTQIKGTLGAYATDAASGLSVALTAMHVAKGHDTFVVPSPRDDPFGERLGKFLNGTMTGVDAAKLSVDPPAVAESFLPGIGPIRGWRPVAMPGDRGREVRMCGATSGRQRGFIAEPAMALPGLKLDKAILVDIQSAEGDSGCALVDSENLVLGLLVGEMELNGMTLRVFSPMSLVLQALGCDIPTS